VTRIQPKPPVPRTQLEESAVSFAAADLIEAKANATN